MGTDERGIIALYIFGGIVIICFYIWVVNKMIDVAVDKGYKEKIKTIKWMFFWTSITGLGLLTFLYVIALPDLEIHRQNNKLISVLEAREDNNRIFESDELPKL